MVNGTNGPQMTHQSLMMVNGTNGAQKVHHRSPMMANGTNGAQNHLTTVNGTNGTPLHRLWRQDTVNGTNGTPFQPLPNGINGTLPRHHHPRHTTSTMLPANST